MATRSEALLGQPARSAAEVSRWTNDLGIPELIHIAQGDSRLLIDLSDSDSVQDLVGEAHSAAERGQSLSLREALPAPADAWLPGPDGKHTLELAVQLAVKGRPFGDPHRAPESYERVVVSRTATSRRRVWPGEDWAYAKLYIDREQQVEFVRGELQRFVAELSKEDAIVSWFFIRYADPDHHIRLRLKTSAPGGGPMLLSRMASWVAHIAGFIGLQHMTFEPYVREVHRYGGPDGIDLAESVFHADSVATLGLLAAMHSAQPLDPIAVAVASSSRLLTDLGLRPTRMRSWLPESADRHPIREERTAFARPKYSPLLAESTLKKPDWECVSAVLDDRSKSLAPLMAATTKAAADGRLMVDLDALARSHVHLHLNRLFGPDPELERLTLGLLRRALRSAEAVRLVRSS